MPAADWLEEHYRGTRYGLQVRERLFTGQSAWQRIEVVDTELYGRVLALDGILQTSEADERFYHEMLVHPALVTARQLRRVLVIGGGDGGTIREVLAHEEVEEVVMVELDGGVVEACQRHLPSIGGSAWTDPRLRLIIGDGIRFLSEQTASSSEGPGFDAIIVDGPDPIGPGEGLYEADFYACCHRALAEGGVLATHAESPVLDPELHVRIVGAVRQSFPRAAPYYGPVALYSVGGWSYCHAPRGPVDPLEPVRERVQAMEARCHYYNQAVHTAAFAVPNHIRRALAGSPVAQPGRGLETGVHP